MSLIYNATFDKNTRKLSFEDRAGNEIYSFTVPERAPAVDDITKPLTFKATLDGSTVKLTKNGSPDGDFQTSRDGGNTWTDYTLDSAITLNTGEEVSFRAKADRTKAQSRESHFYFQMTGEIEAWHNVMSLYRTNDFATYNTMVESSFNRLFFNCYSLTKAPVLPSTTLATDCYEYMFQSCQSLTKAPELPATTLVNGCYSSMFYGCQSLAEAPELPATKLADFCYYDMFDGCPSLTKAPELPATTLAYSCYSHMFVGCRSLTKAPELPATTLSSKCYAYMFSRCQSLTKAPELPATTLANNCYQYMFSNCYSLTKAPELPATTLSSKCYQYMFSGCQSLKEVRIAATTTATDALTDWLKDVSATGDFYCDPNATIFPTDSTSGIPANWRRLNINEEGPAVDDITKPLTFRATQDGSTVALGRYGYPSGAFQTSRDGGNTWTDYSINTAITLNTGEEVSFRAKADRTSAQTDKVYFYFAMKGKIEAWHNVMSLYRTNDFATYESVMNYAFRNLFRDCTSLTKAPALPATKLKQFCYARMFSGCPSLTKAPELPSTTLARGCYTRMFEGCQSLTKAPELPATTLAQNCYNSMFSGCQSLTKAPELPATKLEDSCYKYMFEGCQSLTKAPELPATTLAINCYDHMFSGCQSLKEVRVSATTTAENALVNWLEGVSATGDFYCDPNATIFPTDSASGIPANWRRLNIADYPN